VADQPLHVIQRGNNRQPIFFEDAHYALYRHWPAESAARYGCAIHVYAIMTNHVHLLLTPKKKDSLPRMMQSLGRRYVRAINDAWNRSGTLWEGRYRAAPVDGNSYFFRCCQYIELNPVRARMVKHPRDYPWSSYRAHAPGRDDEVVSGAAIFRRLGDGRSAVQGRHRQSRQAPRRAAAQGPST
jgi:putative transposase